MIYQMSALWLLLTAAAAVELYDELRDVDNEILLQDENDIDTGPLPEPGAEESEASRLQDLLLYKLIRAQLRKENQNTKRRSHKGRDADSAETDGLVKRVAPQRWWKAKKGRVGNQMCYFKLCAFRNPV